MSHRKLRRAALRPVLERVEPRVLFTTNAWKTAVSGDWDVAANWSLNHVPTAGEDVVISVPGSYTVTHSNVNDRDSCASITSSEPFVISGGILSVAGNVQVNNTFSISGGELANATVLAGTSGQGIAATALSSAENTGSLSNVTLDANLTIGDGTELTNADTLTLNHSTITISSSGTESEFVMGLGGSTLAGTGSVVFAGSSPSTDEIFAVNTLPVTFDAGITITGEGGALNINDEAPAFTNFGTINSDTSGQTLAINGQIVNHGTIEATNGASLSMAQNWTNEAGATMAVTGGGTLTLGIASSNSDSSNAGTISETNSTLALGNLFTNTGAITRSGGTVNLIGTYNLNGGSLAFNASTGAWNVLDEGGLENGTVSFTGTNRLVLTASGGTLTNMTLNSNLPIPDGASLTIAGGITLGNVKIHLKGATAMTSLSFSQYNGNQTIGGTGQIIFAGTDTSMDQIFSVNPGGVAIIGPGITIKGANGRMYLNDIAPAYINEGLIEDDVPGTTFSIFGSELTNKGVIEAAPGTIDLGDGFDPSQGTLTVGIGGTSAGVNYGQFIADPQGPALTLAGTLNTPLLPGFVPSAGQTFTILTYPSASGSFTHANTNVGGGIAFNSTVGATAYTLTATTGGPDLGNVQNGVLSVAGTASADTINLSAAFDLNYATVNGSAAVFFASAISGESVAGGAGNDSITSALSNDTLSGQAGNDTMIGSSGYDLIEGAGGADSISGGGAGNDSLRGGAGNDTVLTTAGNATLVGGGDNDLLVGGSGADTLAGGPGNDSITTGTGNGESIAGGIGNDTINAATGNNDTLDAGPGTDSLVASNGTDSLLNFP